MVLFDGVAGLIFVGLWIFCIIDVITTPEGRARNLPKIAWLLIVILLVDVGSIAWLVAGHTWDGGRAGVAQRSQRPQRVPNRPAANHVPTNPDDDEEFLASLRDRAEEQRRKAQENPKDDPTKS